MKYATVCLLGLTLCGSATSAEPWTYAELIGKWEVRGVDVYPAPVTAVGQDDAKYMNAIIRFQADGITWLRGTERMPLSELDDCARTPVLTPRGTEASDLFYDVPDDYKVVCGTANWGPAASIGGTAIVRRRDAQTFELYWYDNAILVLKRVE